MTDLAVIARGVRVQSDRLREIGSLLAAAYLRIAVADTVADEAQCNRAVNARESEDK